MDFPLRSKAESEGESRRPACERAAPPSAHPHTICLKCGQLAVNPVPPSRPPDLLPVPPYATLHCCSL